MTVPTEEDVRSVLHPGREAKLHRAFHQAWRDVIVDQAKYSRWPRTRANMMFERLAEHLQESFDDDPKVVFCFADETVKISFDDTLLARCKKADDRGFGHNVPTQAVLRFCHATQELLLFPGLQKIEILYVVNRTGTALQRIVVQARDGDMRLWAYPLDGAESGGAATPVVPLPRPPTPPPQTDGSDLVQPRKTPVHKEETDEK